MKDLKIAPCIIEHQLAHKVSVTPGPAYNRTKFIEQRRTMMQSWADYLDELKASAKVLPFKKYKAIYRQKNTETINESK